LGGITVTTRGSFTKTEDFLKRMQSRSYLKTVDRFGRIGVDALSGATPVDSGKTAEGWYYELVDRPGYFSIQWLNSHTEEPGHIPIAAIIQYGHGTRHGGYVQGRDYINPAMRPIFDQIAADMWKEVTR
jgi:hypothetical protein